MSKRVEVRQETSITVHAGKPAPLRIRVDGVDTQILIAETLFTEF